MQLGYTMFVLIEHKLKKNYDFNSHDFLVKVVTLHIKMHYEKSKNMNFLVLIRSCVLLALPWYYHSFLYHYLLIVLIARRRL